MKPIVNVKSSPDEHNVRPTVNIESSSSDTIEKPTKNSTVTRKPLPCTLGENFAFDSPTDHSTLLNILLCNPEDIEQKMKPSAVRKNFFCVLNQERIPISSALSDDNGAYVSTGKSKSLYYVCFEEGSIDYAKLVREENGCLFYNERISGKGKTEYIRNHVEDKDVYELTRSYRRNKANYQLTHIIITVRQKDKKDAEKYYVSSYRVDSSEDPDEFEINFKIPRHGNAVKPTAATYFRTDKSVLEKAALLLKEKSPNAVYESLSQPSTHSVSEELRKPRQVHNLKYAKSHQEEVPEKHAEGDEINRIVAQMRNTNTSEPFTRVLNIFPKQYLSVHYLDQALNDVERFCVHGNSVFRVDTTFEIVDDLWLTDTSFTNESLVSEHTGKAPEFPGPFMLHLKKDRFTYRTFAGNLVIGNPNLLHVTKIGSDMDSALHNGIGDIFNKADRLICIQHLMERDAEKLNKLGAARKDKQRILADIYGSKQDKMLQLVETIVVLSR